ncbi:hypothetical protein [Maribacter sp. 2308TA10-17]|uniref:hypothetical protein n=1 Tax=Maribacter sp. 2308TA10-17 TaxID=3386276 RepID=UPI0039BCEE75
MKKSLFLLFTFFAAYTMSAQTTGQLATYTSSRGDGGVTDALYNYSAGSLSEKYSEKSVLEDENIQGSPYTSNVFSPTPLYYKDEKVGNIFFRYNALNEEVEIMKANVEGEAIRSLARDKELNIRPNGKKMSFKTFVTSKKRTTNGYLTEIVNGEEYDLFKRIHVKFTEGTAAQNSFVAAIPARFTKFTEYYMQKKGVNRIDEVLPKKGKLLKLLGDSQKESVKNYLKENDLNIKNESDLIKVFEFLNQ